MHNSAAERNLTIVVRHLTSAVANLTSEAFGFHLDRVNHIDFRARRSASTAGRTDACAHPGMRSHAPLIV